MTLLLFQRVLKNISILTKVYKLNSSFYVMRKVILFVLIFSLFLPMVFSLWGDCTLTDEDCVYPGDCGAYIDTNGDRICDHSQENPEIVQTSGLSYDEYVELLNGQELKSKTVEEVALIYGIGKGVFAQRLGEVYGVIINDGDSFQTLHDNYGVDPSGVKALAASIAVGSKFDESETEDHSKDYRLIMIAIVTIILYFLTFYLQKIKMIRLVTHRKIWNMVLLITFFVSALLGLLLTIRLEYGVNFPTFFNQLFWHVEAGIVMTIVSIFHAAWHMPYWKCYFKKNKNCQSS